MNNISRISFLFFSLCLAIASFAQNNVALKKKDRKRDVEIVTSEGRIVLRLYDSTPLHRDNFLRLVKTHYYDGLLFHRVIKDFMIQAGDPMSRDAEAGQPLGNGGPGYTVPAEFRKTLFHKRGVLAASRQGDNMNPTKASSASQFYIVQGRTFTDAQLDSVEVARLKGYKLPPQHREVYRTVGGTPQLDQNYTVFGEVVQGMDVVDRIASMSTSKGEDRDRPLHDVRIVSVKLIKRKH
jgi:cyclophilin family peptidyl-prolyl cis-trans isomerase